MLLLLLPLSLLVLIPLPTIFVQSLAIKSKQIRTYKNMYLETDAK
jgi:competence protein ComGC